MEAAALASGDLSRPYLLHIDEINRADLSKILGEAIFLLETETTRERVIQLPYDFGSPFHRSLNLPKNLHILGTMNSADRSIAIVDVAVRRRFAFVSAWPRMTSRTESMAEHEPQGSFEHRFVGLLKASLFVKGENFAGRGQLLIRAREEALDLRPVNRVGL